MSSSLIGYFLRSTGEVGSAVKAHQVRCQTSCCLRVSLLDWEKAMIIILGLIAVLAVAVIGVAGVLGNYGSGHALTHGFAVFGFQSAGSTGALFLSGIEVGVIGLAALNLLLTGARRARRSKEHRALTGSVTGTTGKQPSPGKEVDDRLADATVRSDN